MRPPTGTILNPKRPANPWLSNGESDFIKTKTPPPVAQKPAVVRAAVDVSGAPPPPLPRRTMTPTASEITEQTPPLPSRSNTVDSRSSSLQRKPIVPPSRNSSPGVKRETTNGNGTKATKRKDVDHLADAASDTSSLSNYKSLV